MEEEVLFGFRFCLFTPIDHNGKFSHNMIDYVTVNARNEEEAISMIALKPKRHDEYPGMIIDADAQWIHSLKFLGRAKYVTRIEYEYD